MSDRLRVAVIGVGHLGQHHARLLATLDDVELVGIVDTKPGRAEEVAAKYGTRAWPAATELLGHVDAVTIAVPTVSHLEVALPFLERGVAALVEKPLAPTVADAERLIEAAARGGATLAAGHTERFNPAVVAAFPLVTNPRFVEIHRMGTFPERSLDIDVIFDLMIHDLDLLLASVGSEVASIEAVGVNVLTPRIDIANARLRFASGCVANVTASRISRERIRKVRFFQHDSYVSIDYAAQEVEVYKLNGPPKGGPHVGGPHVGGPHVGGPHVGGAGRPVIEGGKLPVVNEEPLRRELVDFVDAVRHRREPGVTGRAGRDALELATRIAEKMSQ